MKSRTTGKKRGGGAGEPGGTSFRPVDIDPYRLILFPNRIREQRRRSRIESLLILAERLPGIPYIRLSKIERGEVFAKAAELRAIAAVLGLADPADLLTDVEAETFSPALWAGGRGDIAGLNREAEELSMLLAAAFRARRASDPALTLARLQGEYGLPAVIVSRIENAVKPFNRWNAETMASICRLLEVRTPRDLAAHLRALLEEEALTPWLARIPGARDRERRTRERIRTLHTELAQLPAGEMIPSPLAIRENAIPARAGRLLTVLGIPAGDGLIDPAPTLRQIAPPPGVGPNAYALRMCRASLGAVIPGHAVLIVDPDRSPVQGGLAVLREKKGLRVLTVTTDRDGRLYGHSSHPGKELALDDAAPSDLAMVVAVLFDQD